MSAHQYEYKVIQVDKLSRLSDMDRLENLLNQYWTIDRTDSANDTVVFVLKRRIPTSLE